MVILPRGIRGFFLVKNHLISQGNGFLEKLAYKIYEFVYLYCKFKLLVLLFL